jgi:hypothetical protein
MLPLNLEASMRRWIALLLGMCSMGFTQVFYPQPIYHPNSFLASNGDPRSYFYHDNSQIAWAGQNQSDRRMFYKNGVMAWEGLFNKECFFSYSGCEVRHNNGETAWKGATYREATWSNGPCSVYHNNGELAWKGALDKDCSWGRGACTLYHRNGAALWEGAVAKNCHFSTDPCTVYHSNGSPAWRGSFPYETTNVYASAVYHDNGTLAWAGRLGDPIYDRNGYLVTASAEAMNLPLGDGSWLYISYNGYMCVHLHLGDDSFLSMTNQDENPRLIMNLGPGYKLEFFPYTGTMPQLNVYEYVVPVRS